MNLFNVENTKKAQPMKDFLIKRLMFLHSVILSAESEEEILDLCEEIDCICHNINVIDQLFIDSFFNMNVTVKKFLRKH